MTTTNITLRIDKSLKEEADELFNGLGMSFTTAINVFIRKALATQSIPFEINAQDKASEDQNLLEALNMLLTTPHKPAKGVFAVNAESESSYPSITSINQVEKIIEQSQLPQKGDGQKD